MIFFYVHEKKETNTGWILWLADSRCYVVSHFKMWFCQDSYSPKRQTILARVRDQLRPAYQLRLVLIWLLQTDLRHPEQLSKDVSPLTKNFYFCFDIISSLSAFCSQFKQLLLFRLSCEQIKTLNAWKIHSQNEHVLQRYLSLRRLKAQLTAPFRKQAFSSALNGLSEISKAEILSGFPVDVCWLLLPSSHQENVQALGSSYRGTAYSRKGAFILIDCSHSH